MVDLAHVHQPHVTGAVRAGCASRVRNSSVNSSRGVPGRDRTTSASSWSPSDNDSTTWSYSARTASDGESYSFWERFQAVVAYPG